MTIRPASDRSLLVSFGSEISLDFHHQVFHLTRSLQHIRGILNLHPAYSSVLIEFDPRLVESDSIEALVNQKIALDSGRQSVDPPRTVRIPVQYGGEFGPDLDDVARHTGLSAQRVVELHSAADYLVYFLGFAPGFAYLGGLPPELATPRIAAPRKQVPAGSVGIGGNQTGIYPIVSPGGWRLIGRTSVKLFDPAAAEPVLLRMGDHLRFIPEDPEKEPATRSPALPTGWTAAPTVPRGSTAAPPTAAPPTAAPPTVAPTSLAPITVAPTSVAPITVAPTTVAPAILSPVLFPEARTDSANMRITVLNPGLLTSIQDLGRFGHAHLGISASGAADPLAIRAGNLLVGNAENAPALEMTLSGGTFEFESDAIIALTGSDFNAGLPLWVPVPVKAGQTLRFGATTTGARAYLCVRGGIEAPLTLGSASAHLLTGVGGGALRKGDTLHIGANAVRRPRGAAANPPQWTKNQVIRLTDGPQADWFHGEIYQGLYQVAEECNRMGIRLRGPAIPSPAGGMLTEGVAMGAIQVPPDGQPIILFVEHQTTGGYPKPANVISADFWRLGQMRPRDEAQFERIGIEPALKLLQQQERWLYSL